MKFVQTFWVDGEKDPLKTTFGWCSPRHHLMAWALSSLQLHKYHGNTELVTDARGKELLIDILGLPYQKVRIELEGLDFACDPRLWVMKKIYSYTLHREPFLNLDGDVFIYGRLPEALLSGRLIAQNIEQDFDYYRELVGLVGNTFRFVPAEVKNQINQGAAIKASNAGILGGNDHGFFGVYFELVKRFVSENREQIGKLDQAQMVNFNAVVEQYLFHFLAEESGVSVEYLLDTVYDPSFFESFANFHHLPNRISFMHALGDYKKNGWVCDQLEHRLRIDYPEYHRRINRLFGVELEGLDFNLVSGNGTVSVFSKSLSKNPEEDSYARSMRLALHLCESYGIKVLKDGGTPAVCIKRLLAELPDPKSTERLQDAFEFEYQKLQVISNLPSDTEIADSQVKAANAANQVFETVDNLDETELRLSRFAWTIESAWDWSRNDVLFAQLKENEIVKNLEYDPYYHQTLLLPDWHHGTVIEYALGPVEILLISMLSKEEYVPIVDIFPAMVSFFASVEEDRILKYMDEAVRFLAYSGILFLRISDRQIQLQGDTKDNEPSG
jgi:hypothetical protein